MRIALVPLDERPVNTALPGAMAAVAGSDVVLPGPDLLPRKRRPGDVDGLGEWVARVGRDVDVDAVVVSADMLCYGGLIASRTTPDSTSAALGRLEVLRSLRAQRPDLGLAAVTLVMRATDSYSDEEEPCYWAEHGRELHRLGALLHRDFLDEPGAQDELALLRAAVPVEHQEDFLRRRVRNHAVNLEMLAMASGGIVDPLLVTADDTAVHAAGTLEQIWLRHWIGALAPTGTVLTFPGADEVGSVLVARALQQASCTPRIRLGVDCAQVDGLTRIAPYENSPVGETVRRQIEAAGADQLLDAIEDADVVLVVHAPHSGHGAGDWVRNPPQEADDRPAAATAALVQTHLRAGRQVAVADVHHPNGSDPALVEALREAGTLLDLTAYAGWNTAGNTIGTVVATAVATVVGQRLGTFDAGASRALLLHRLVEDHGYQALVRTTLVQDLPIRNDRPFITAERSPDYIAQAQRRLQSVLDALAPDDGWQVGDVSLPWARSFEIDFTLTRP